MSDLVTPSAPANDSLEACLQKQVPELRELERMAVHAAWRNTGGNVSQACRILGIGRTTMYRKLKRYGLAA